MAGAIGLTHSDSRNSPFARRSALARWHRFGALVVGAAVLLAAGCGGDSNKSSQTADKGSDQQEAAPAPQPAAGRAHKPPAPPANDQTAAATNASLPADVSKWKLPDLKLALTRKDFQFFFGVMVFAAKAPGDNKRAADLNELLQQIGRLNDDPKVELPFPPGTFPAAATAAAGTPPAAAGGNANPGMGAGLPRFGGRLGIGIGRKKD